jgi:hypothetical protein
VKKPLPQLPALLCAAFALPSSQELARDFARYRAMADDAHAEESRVTGYLRKDRILSRVNSSRNLVSIEDFDRLSNAQQIEWNLRLGDQAPLKSLDSLRGVRDAVLLDQGLWVYLRSNIPNFYKEYLHWRSERDRFAKFISSLEPGFRRAVFEQKHGDWWKWFAGEGIDSIRDPAVVALNLTINAASAKPRSRLRMLVEARSYLHGRPELARDLNDFENRAIELMTRDYGESAALNNALFAADVGDFRLQKQEFLQTLVEHWKQRHRPDLAADALEKLQGMKRVFEKTNAADYLQLADLEFAGGRYSQAAQTYDRAILRSRELWVEAEARSGLAFATEKLAEKAKGAERERLFGWAAEHYRQACESGLTSNQRDQLLEGYSRVLDRLGYWEAAVDVAESLFKIGAKREGQIRGLEQMARLLSLHIGKTLNKNKPDMWVREKYQRFVHAVSLLAQADAKNENLRPWLTQARAWVDPLQYKGDSVLAATLNEVSEKIALKDPTKNSPKSSPKSSQRTLSP